MLFGIWNLPFDKAQGPEPAEGESGIKIVRIIAGSFKGRKLFSPGGKGTRPTSDRVREAVFSIIAERVAGARVLDLYAGTGAMGLEALSRGAESAVFVEIDAKVARFLKTNIENCGTRDRSRVVNMSALRYLEKWGSEENIDLVFADPPYTGDLGILTLLAISNHAGPLKNSLIVLEHSPENHPEPVPENMEIVDTRRYGNVGVTFLAFKEA